VLRFVRTDASRMKKHIAEVILAEAEPDHIHKVLEYTQFVVVDSSATAARLRIKKSTRLSPHA
jgi:REP element-mobilizing transposase RayT